MAKTQEAKKMIIMQPDATQAQIDQVIHEVVSYGLKADVSAGDYKTVIDLVGDEKRISFTRLASFPGVKEAFQIETPYKLISREYTKFFRSFFESQN
jgi:3-deoxy-7-phosphoheptulonate synthase